MPRESKGSKRERAGRIVAALRQAYPHSTCALFHRTPFQLLVATMLSAQTTDLKVNDVTPGLFERFPDAEAMAQADPEEVGALINSIGLWRNKSRNVVAAARMVIEEFEGALPRSVHELTRLPGVGRKTATAVLGTAFGIAAGITVDTHMLRINRLLGLSRQTDPDKMGRELEALLAPSDWSHYTHLIIDHGRLVCVARRPRCGVCLLADGLCPSAFDPAAGYKPANDAREPASARGLSWKARAAPADERPGAVQLRR